MKQIVKVPHNVLTRPAESIRVFDSKLIAIIEDMKKTLRATRKPKGVGLAAPQVGFALRMFITRPKDDDPIRVFINPEIIKRSDALTEGVPARNATHSVAVGPEWDPAKRDLASPDNKLEGCLSIDAIWGRVKRASGISLRYQDEVGVSHEEEFTGFMATILQHETDHTNGILFTHRVLEQKGKLYQSVKDAEGKEALEEIILK
ncbi:MAG: peptide deformylase [Candidatus Gottesmanbacteria bacterium]|nr:peptide deformylase [Candidatus Gottesmanbacteria bacterium]